MINDGRLHASLIESHLHSTVIARSHPLVHGVRLCWHPLLQLRSHIAGVRVGRVPGGQSASSSNDNGQSTRQDADCEHQSQVSDCKLTCIRQIHTHEVGWNGQDRHIVSVKVGPHDGCMALLEGVAAHEKVKLLQVSLLHHADELAVVK